MKIGVLTREWPDQVYGGAGVHVEYLVRALRGAGAAVAVHSFGGTADGATAHDNLICLCRHHHRLKHQAPGWHFDAGDDGDLAITMPSGEVVISHPPRFGSDLDIPPF